MPRIPVDDADARQLQSLLAALNTILSEYMTFIARDAPEEAKLFAARHAAGKAAVGHVTALSKLLQSSLAASAAPNPEEGAPMGEMLAAAREAMSRFDDGEDDDG